MQITLDESLELISKLQTKFNKSNDPVDKYAYVTAIERETKGILDSMSEIKDDCHQNMIFSMSYTE